MVKVSLFKKKQMEKILLMQELMRSGKGRSITEHSDEMEHERKNITTLEPLSNLSSDFP